MHGNRDVKVRACLVQPENVTTLLMVDSKIPRVQRRDHLPRLEEGNLGRITLREW